MPAETVLSAIEDLADGTARAFAFEGPEGAIDGLLVRRGATVAAYVNRCPHLGTPLDWTPGQFLSTDGSHIVCATHGAQFRIEDGYCFGGPCAGRSLKPVAIEIRNGAVILVR